MIDDPLASSEQDAQGFGSLDEMAQVAMDSDDDGSSNERALEISEETAEAPPPKTSACCEFDKVLPTLDYTVFLPNSSIADGLTNAAITIQEVITII